MNSSPRPTEQTYEELQSAYDFFNRKLFNGILPACLITLQRKKRTKGYFAPNRFVSADNEQTHEIAMNPSYFGARPVPASLSTLAHEMVHLWQSDFGKPARKRYHNREWADMMISIGLQPTSTGMPGGKEVGESMTHYIIEDGPFDIAVREFLKSSPGISWFDRFFERDQGLAEPAGEGDDDDDDGDENNVGLPGGATQQGTQNPASSAKPLPVSAVAAPHPAALMKDPKPIDSIGATWNAPENRRQQDGSNRTRFTCPGCHDNAWGKPSLMLICGKCKKEFVALGQPSASTPETKSEPES